MRITLTALTPTGPRDLVISGDDGLTVGQVAAELRGAVWPREQLAEVIPLPGAEPGSWATRRQAHARGATLWVNARPLDPRATAAGMLRDGAVVATDPRAAPATMLAEPSGAVEVRAVGGPVAGTVRRLGFGTVTLGSLAGLPRAGAGTAPACRADHGQPAACRAGVTSSRCRPGRSRAARHCCWTASRWPRRGRGRRARCCRSGPTCWPWPCPSSRTRTCPRSATAGWPTTGRRGCCRPAARADRDSGRAEARRRRPGCSCCPRCCRWSSAR